MANKTETSEKNIKPRTNLNHNIYIYIYIFFFLQVSAVLWRLRPRSSTGQKSSEIQLKKVTCVIKVFFYSQEKISNIIV